MSAAAVVAAGIGVIPATAQAADPGPQGARVVAPSNGDVKKGAQSALKKFTSPAERSVTTSLPAAGGGAGAVQRAQGAEDGNPNLAMVLDAQSMSAHGFHLVTAISSADASLNVTVDWGDSTPADQGDAYGSAELSYQHSYKELGKYNVTVTVEDPVNQKKVTNVLEIETAGSDFTPYGPTRLLDTRSGTGAAKGKVAAYSSAKLQVGGNGGIPAGVTAVALNVTVTNATSGGHVTVFGSGTARPTTSNVNFEPGQTVPNLVIVPVGKDGKVELFNGGWEGVDLIADVTGYFGRKASSGYTGRDPQRLVDTREGLGTARGQLGGQKTFTVKVAEPGQATAVALNMTVTNPREAGHLTAYPAGQAAPTTSNVNFTAGQTVANAVIVPVGADGRITVRNGAWAGADVIVDIVGAYGTSSQGAYMPVEPWRMIDTRAANWPYGPVSPRGYVVRDVSAGWPHVSGYVMNTTVTNTRGDGFLSVAPDPNTWESIENGTDVWPPRPIASTLNWTKGKTVPNLVQVSSGNNGVVDFWNQGWEEADLIVDMFGYYETN
ncbi:hypothetical protein ACFWUQ_26330 [Streptomyces sp. NPDC058662]|uniref:hypothetical protein n=1 Tax=Streptomyces sp. NPDC058662 TaxID=3346583 RepID=UPI00364A04F3